MGVVCSGVRLLPLPRPLPSSSPRGARRKKAFAFRRRAHTTQFYEASAAGLRVPSADEQHCGRRRRDAREPLLPRNDARTATHLPPYLPGSSLHSSLLPSAHLTQQRHPACQARWTWRRRRSRRWCWSRGATSTQQASQLRQRQQQERRWNNSKQQQQ